MFGNISKEGTYMQNRRALFVEAFVGGITGARERTIPAVAAKPQQPHGRLVRGSRFLRSSGVPRRRRILWLSLTLVILQLVTPHRGQALPKVVTIRQ